MQQNQQNIRMRSIRNENDLERYESFLNEETDTGNQNRRMTEMPQNDMPVAENRPPETENYSNGNMSLIPAKNHCVPETLKNTAFMPAFLSKHIGKLVKVEFLICDRLEVRVGILMTVGASFIVLRQYGSSNTLVCDLYSIKFVTIVHNNNANALPFN